VDPDSSNAGESFGRRVLSTLDTEAISGEEQDKFLFLGLGFPGMSRFNLGYPEQETGSSFFLWLVKRKANSYLLVWDFPGEQRKARIKLNLGYQVKLNNDSNGVQVSEEGLGSCQNACCCVQIDQNNTIIASSDSDSDGHCCGQNILHVTQMGCKTTNFGCFHGNTANKGFCAVQTDLQNAVVILFLCFATLQNKLATAVGAS
jgi:hypothetical protein